jgi:hypothetical protein
MEISIGTREFVNEIDTFSNQKLQHPDAVSLLIEVARASGHEEKIEKVAFLGKFLWSVYGILKRSTSETEGYEKLTKEFKENLEEFISRLSEIIAGAPPEERTNFSSIFLAKTSGSLENLLALISDFRWVKNWSLEHKASGREPAGG